MLRITVLNDDFAITRFKLEGKLAHEWVYEAERTWKALLVSDAGARVVIDLLGVSFVDDSGRQLLTDMHRAGAELVGAGPLISSLIEEIKESEALREDA
ncbi:MAG TPA: hypothetical protein VG498_25795 [Terriglobales bacterium]|nr:hypothetical protein [Terriglobales bacterium]